MTTATPIEIDAHIETDEAAEVRQDLLDDGIDLPELADTMEEADARAAADTYLFALRSIKRDIDANDAEFTVLQEYNQNRHVERQSVLLRRTEYLSRVLEGLFGFMHTGKKKSLNLLGGRLGMRAQQDDLVVEDDAAVIEWVRERGWPGLVKKKITLDRKGVREYAKTHDGAFTALPGVTLNERPDVFFATPAD